MQMNYLSAEDTELIIHLKLINSDLKLCDYVPAIQYTSPVVASIPVAHPNPYVAGVHPTTYVGGPRPVAYVSGVQPSVYTHPYVQPAYVPAVQPIAYAAQPAYVPGVQAYVPGHHTNYIAAVHPYGYDQHK